MITIGTRGSDLALWQANYVKDKLAEINIESELKAYNKWANGELYEFLLYDDNGEIENNLCGFYEIEEIREHLPGEFKNLDLSQFFINK